MGKSFKSLNLKINLTQIIFHGRHSQCCSDALRSCCVWGTCTWPGGLSDQAEPGLSIVRENTLLTASQGEQGNMSNSKLGLGLRKRTEIKFSSLEKQSSHLVQSKVKINELMCYIY